MTTNNDLNIKVASMLDFLKTNSSINPTPSILPTPTLANNNRQLMFRHNTHSLVARILKLLIANRPVVVLCIGSDRMTGDCLGPLCGHYLKHHFNSRCFVYGCLDNTVNATNLIATNHYINTHHKDSVIIAVDSMIGSVQNIGKFKLFYDGIYPGTADGKTLPKTGNLALTSIVSQYSPDNPLHSVKLGLINQLAHTIASTIHQATS